ncbi:MAG: hypothetical protein LBK94_08645 [Prevotellaceae bacterium]|jgi:hypothetical protein|nr:hypothetical protein [Prevotellaceae bacterium]
MKRLLSLILITAVSFFALASERPQITDCKLNGKKLYGHVFITESESSADFRVKTVTSIPDLEVKQVPSTAANSCGLWSFTDTQSAADFTVKFVESDEDFTIRFKD